MKQHSLNGWFTHLDFPRFVSAVRTAAAEHDRHLSSGMTRAKYIEPRIDLRTGDFIIKDGDGKTLTAEEVYTLFPELRD